VTPEEYFNEYQHLSKVTILKMFNNVNGICTQHRIELDDLIQYAATGLWKACLSYQPDKGTKFKTHAISNIRWHVNERLKRETSLIKYDSNKFNDIEKFGLLSMDAEHSEYSDGHCTYHDIIPNDEITVEDSVFGKFEETQLLSQLNDKQRKIVKLIQKGLNTNDIARLWNMTGSNVRFHYGKAKKLIEEYSEVI
jgi:RNA polymerase sigma factor (sigma-70 family)